MTSIAVEHSVCDGLGVTGTPCEVVATIGVTGLPVGVGMIGGIVLINWALFVVLCSSVGCRIVVPASGWPEALAIVDMCPGLGVVAFPGSS